MSDEFGRFAPPGAPPPSAPTAVGQPRPHVDEYSARTYDPAYNETGHAGAGRSATPAPGGAGNLAPSGNPAPSGSPAPAGNAFGADSYTHGGDAFSGGTDSADKPRRSFWSPALLTGVVLLVLAVVGIMLFFAIGRPQVTADPAPTPVASGPGTGGGQSGGDQSGGSPGDPAPPELEVSAIGLTYRVPQSDDPDDYFEVTFRPHDRDEEHVPTVDDIWAGSGYRYFTIVAEVTNYGESRPVDPQTLPVFVRDNRTGNHYRFESANDLEKPGLPGYAVSGRTHSIVLAFPIREAETVDEIGVAPIGRWWGDAIWRDVPDTRDT